MSPFFGEFIKDGGSLIVSGIIDERVSEVTAALSENGWKAVSEKNEDGWNCLLLKRV